MNAPISSVKGIGGQKAKLFERLGVCSLFDMLYFLPRAYSDYSRVTPVMALEHGQDAAVRVTLASEPRNAYPRYGLTITTCKAQDETGSLQLVWYNQPFRKSSLKNGDVILALGRADREKGLRIVNPELCQTPEPPGILPIYPLTAGLNQRLVRVAAKAAIKAFASLKETLPEGFRLGNSLAEINFALQNAHFPQDEASKERALERLYFEEALMFVLSLKLKRREREAESGISFKISDAQIGEFVARMPFALTEAQTRALSEIAADMREGKPMNRILQGDVGSGKTALALFVLYAATLNGYQGALMAPTEILALQHEKSALEFFSEDEVLLLRGGLPAKARAEALGKIASGEKRVIVGTHSLLQKDIEFANLGAVVADEQHRFGVRQRAAIAQKGRNTDVLIMSATPIPRTLSLVLYGDLDVSVLDGMPPGRQKVKTYFVPTGKRADMYAFLAKKLLAGEQAYIVCPLVEQSEEIPAISATELYEELSRGPLKGCETALLHGRQKAAEKQAVLDAFAAGTCRALVSTSVVEVGVNVPNATVMIVEDADRFGLAQLHQLRGRVGRGAKPSSCFLLSRSESEAVIERISYLTKTSDGFKIAQRDLELRGPGEFLGTRQHGVSELKLLGGVGMDTIKRAQDAANALFEHDADPNERDALVSLARDFYRARMGGIALN